jgi:hypothetical protein
MSPFVIGHMWEGTFVPGPPPQQKATVTRLPGVDPLADAISWATKNPLAFEMCIFWAREDQKEGHRPSIKLYFELLRRPWMARQLGMVRSDVQFVLNNNLHSQVARLINRECPDIHFPTREAKSDHWYPDEHE